MSTLNSTEREDGVSDAVIWLRGVVRYEGIPATGGNLGTGESRLCHDPDDGGRTGVPLWHFPNQDADGFYMELGDP
ncbi:MAG: hypothetical protein R3247_13350, partial [Rhodothermales bacterium]|nr:hypothetical protein [Rhodothermales bacterium]